MPHMVKRLWVEKQPVAYRTDYFSPSFLVLKSISQNDTGIVLGEATDGSAFVKV